jgi:hypothetical protein
MKHNELLKMEKTLKTKYLEYLEALDDPVDCSPSNIKFYQDELRKIEDRTQTLRKEICDEAQKNDLACHAHDFNVDHWIIAHKITEIMQTNPFTKRYWGYYAAQGDPMLDAEEPSFYFVETLEELKTAFMTYDGYRQTLIYRDLIFVNSTVGGGWEAWTLKLFGDGVATPYELIPFESISMQLIIKDGSHDKLTFEQYIEQLHALTKEQTVNYLKNCLKS